MNGRGPALAVPLLAAAAAVLVVTQQPVSDSDLFWHLASGRDVVNGVAGTDHYSWTITGRPVLLDQWLGEVLFYAAYTAAGWLGIVALRAAAVAVLTTLVVATAVAAAPRRPLVALLAALPALAVARYAWTDRPELFGLTCFAVLVALLRRGGPRALATTPVLLLVWSNTHGSYLLGLALTLVVLVERALRLPLERRRLALVGLAAVLVTVPTLAQERLASTSQFWSPPRDISEWAVPDVTALPGLAFGMVLAATLVAAFLAPRRTPRDALILVPTAFVSLVAARHLPFFPIAAAPFLACAVAAALDARAVGTGGAPLVPGRRAHAAAALVVAVAFVAGMRGAPGAPDLSGYPTAALAALPAGPGVLTRYDWGGYLIWSAPRTPVFIDGRLIPYPSDLRLDYTAIVTAKPGWEDVAERRHVTAMLVRPTDAIAARAPERGWRATYRDDVAVILVR